MVRNGTCTCVGGILGTSEGHNALFRPFERGPFRVHKAYQY